jgi:hypothetical protein
MSTSIAAVIGDCDSINVYMWRNWIVAVLVSLVSLGIFWSPWILKLDHFWGVEFGRSGMETIVANFDGLNFLIVAKSMYDPAVIEQINLQFPTGNEPIYFSAHYPLFGLVIRGFEYLVPAPYALLTTIVLGNILLAMGLYFFFVTVQKNKPLALTLTLVALFLPARILSVRAVGSNEPLFMFFVLTSLAMASRGKHYLASALGSLAILTRSPGILLFAAYGLAALASSPRDLKKIITSMIPYLLMPLTLLALFAFYGVRYGDFLAYFNSGDNLHLFFPPFQIFSNMASWVSGMWREDIIYLYLFYGLGIVSYVRSQKAACGIDRLAAPAFGLVYGMVLLMVSHRDLARYALPLAPVALLGYGPLLLRKEVQIILAILVIPTFLLGWQFVVQNVQPINDWGALLIN